MKSKKEFLGWGNEETMWAWGYINPLGGLISKDKPDISYKDKNKDKKNIEKFLKEKGFDIKKVDINALVDYLYKL
jgi:hypothetical protein